VHADAVVDIVEKIALAAVKDFYFTLTGVPGIREALRHAMVRDGDGGHPPLDGAIHDRGRIGQSIHVGHTGMQMQLHSLLFRLVHALLVVDLHDILRVELHILAVEGKLHAAADTQPHTVGDPAVQLDRFALGHTAADDERALVVRDLKQHRPDAGTPRLMAVELEDLALDHNMAGLGRQLADGEHTSLGDLMAQNDAAAAAHLSPRVFHHVGKGLRGRLDADAHAL